MMYFEFGKRELTPSHEQQNQQSSVLKLPRKNEILSYVPLVKFLKKDEEHQQQQPASTSKRAQGNILKTSEVSDSKNANAVSKLKTIFIKKNVSQPKSFENIKAS
jgi:hypothetical protein